MCEECGCTPKDHHHDHEHDHEKTTRTVNLEQSVLERNDQFAQANRQWLKERNITALNMISSPGSGKTTLLEKTLDALRHEIACAVIAGDQQTDNDARRLAGKGAPVSQIETRDACHLDAQRVGHILAETATPQTKLLFIENVGNLVCPAAFDLGEDIKVALLSVTEGEDKPLKYPTLFSLAPVVVVTKIDLMPYLDWDIEACRDAILKIRPDAKIIEVSAKNGRGMDAWIGYLKQLAAED